MIRHRLVDRHGHTLLTTIALRRAEEDRIRRGGYAPNATIATEDVEIVGRFGSGITDGRILWTDGRTSPAWEFDPALAPDGGSPPPPPQPPEIAKPAAILLASIYGADNPSCAAVGGPLVIATVTACVTSVVARDPRATRGGYQSPIVEQLDVVLADGSQRTWYAATLGYSEGYLYALAPTYKAAVAELAGHDAQLEAVS